MNSTPRADGPMYPQHSAGVTAGIKSRSHQSALAEQARQRNARRIEAGQLTADTRITAELLTERLSILTETTDLRGTLRNDSLGILVDVADVTGANGQRSFVVQVREVDPPEGNEGAVAELTQLLTMARDSNPWGDLRAVAKYLLDAGVTL
jgi:hypothetical protein